MDDLRVYNRRLSETEINELYRGKASYYHQGGIISGNTTFAGNLSLATLNLTTNSAPSTPATGDLYSTGSNLLFRNSNGDWVSLIDPTDSLWSESSGNLSFDGGNLGIGSLSGAEFTVDNQSSSDNIVDLYDHTSIALSVQDGGYVGVGTAAPTYKLHVAGGAAISSDLTLTSDLTISDNIMPSANNTHHIGSTSLAWQEIFSQDFVTISDKRLKENIRDLGSIQSILQELRPVHYQWKDGNQKAIGFIAQDVQKVIPEAVHAPEDKQSLMGVKYQSMVPVIIQAQQEHHAEWKSNSKALRERLKRLRLKGGVE